MQLRVLELTVCYLLNWPFRFDAIDSSNESKHICWGTQ